MENIKIVPFSFILLSTLADMVRDAWHLEKSINNRLLLKMACIAYSAHIVSKSNYMYFLKSDNTIISFLAARKENQHIYLKYFYLIICFSAVFFMMFFKYGRSLLKYQLGYNKMLVNLYKKSNKKYDAEMVLFITYTKFQNQGYGKKLVEKFNIDMKKENMKSIYLFTDNYCDYKMYEKAGCKRVCTDSKEFIFTDDLFFQEIYLYEYELK